MTDLLIERARVRNAGPEFRERLVHAVDPVRSGDIGLPANATLILRRVTLRTLLPRAGHAERFSADLRDELRARVVTARRGRAAGGDSDLLFESDAELEAAIVADWLDRPATGEGRWWASMTGSLSPPERWRRRIFHDSRLLPRVLQHLVASGHAASWLARFGDTELYAAQVRVMAALAPVAMADIRPEDAADVARPASPQPAARPRAGDRMIVRYAPEVLAFASPAARALVAVALLAVRRPALLATQNIGRALARLAAPDFAPVPTPTTPSRQAWSPPRSSIPTNRLRTPAPVPGPRETVTRTPVLPRQACTTPALQARAPSEPLDHPVPDRQPVDAAPVERVGTATQPAVPSPQTETAFGGLFFLLNAFVALGLYGNLADPRGSLRGLSPFELLGLLGLHWFDRAYRADPLHALLLRLAGLDDHARAGVAFEAPVWTVPGPWLAPWPDGRASRNGRWHSAGFPLADDPAHVRTAARARRRWLSCFARYLDARLRVALANDDAAARTCRIAARIAVTGDTVEVHMPLDLHALDIRMAGLDRDCGWLPAAGRSIRFVFA